MPADTQAATPATPSTPATPAIAQPAAPAGAATPAVAAPVVIGENSPAPVSAPAVTAVSYEPTNDPALDMSLEFIGNLGIGPEDPAMVAAMEGDFSMLKGKLSGLGDKAKGWEKYIALAEKSAKETKEQTAAKVAKDREVIHNAVGGEDKWKAISEWAGKNAEPAERAAVNEALGKGGLVAKVMAQWLASQFAKAAGTVVEPGEVAAPGASGRPDPTGPLSAKDYAKEVQTLRAKVGHNLDGSPAYKALQARRLAGMRQGI